MSGFGWPLARALTPSSDDNDKPPSERAHTEQLTTVHWLLAVKNRLLGKEAMPLAKFCQKKEAKMGYF